MQTIKVIKEYPMIFGTLKEGTILCEAEKQNNPGTTTFKDDNGKEYNFDNSEILFSPDFHESFKLIKK